MNGKGTNPVNQVRWAYGITIGNLALAMGMNIMRALTRPEHAPADWKVVWPLVFLQAILPLMFTGAIHLAMGKWRDTLSMWGLRVAGIGAVSLILFASSYRNSTTLLKQWHADDFEVYAYPAVFEVFIMLGVAYLWGLALDRYAESEAARLKQERKAAREATKTRRVADVPTAAQEAPSAPLTTPQTALPPEPPVVEDTSGSEAPVTPRVPKPRKSRAKNSTPSIISGLKDAYGDGKFALPTSARKVRLFLQDQPVPIPCGSPRADLISEALNAWYAEQSGQGGVSSEDDVAAPDVVLTDGLPRAGGIDHPAPAGEEANVERVAA